MGFLKRIFDLFTDPQSEPADSEPLKDNLRGLTKLSGSTTFLKEIVKESILDLTGPTPGYFEGVGYTILSDPAGSGFEIANVYVRDTIIGALPKYFGQDLGVTAQWRTPLKVQVFTSEVNSEIRVDAWAWVGSEKPEWEYTEHRRPAITTRGRSKERQFRIEQQVRDSLQHNDPRARDTKLGMVRGKHFTELAEPIKQLKRENRLEEALSLAYQAIEGAENTARAKQLEPAPAYTIEAAIVHRKLGQKDEEIAVLERWLQVTPADRREGGRIYDRLKKLKPERPRT